MQYAAELKELQRTLDHDEKLKDFLFHKSNDRAFAADLVSNLKHLQIEIAQFLTINNCSFAHLPNSKFIIFSFILVFIRFKSLSPIAFKLFDLFRIFKKTPTFFKIFQGRRGQGA
jgi:hypothetical protein